MNITIGTFNLNNLFSRYNFRGEIGDITGSATVVDSSIKYSFKEGDFFKIRTYQGNLVKGKSKSDTEMIANRILTSNIDVLGIQEVEDIDTLKQFNREYLKSHYSTVVLVEGNDNRLIDIGFLSKYPIGAITSWKEAVHHDEPSIPVFGRDMLQIQVHNSSRSEVLFTVFNNHLKSHYVDFREDKTEGEKQNNIRRKRQTEILTKIIKSQTRSDSRFIILGDMNDPPDSEAMEPLTEDQELSLVNALKNPTETRPPKKDDPMPSSASWTHRYKETGQPAKYELFDQIWISSSLQNKLDGAWIDRRTKHSGDGSDHDLAWINLKI